MSTHWLPTADFAALSTGRGGSSVINRLASAQFSRRLLLLHALMSAAQDLPAGETADLNAGYDLLATVQRRDPGSMVKTLMYPAVGTWATTCLKRLRRQAKGSEPLRPDLGQLAVIACVAARRAKLDFEIRLPVRAGIVMLPSLGMAHFDEDRTDRYAIARGCSSGMEIVVGNETLKIPEDAAVDGPSWRGLRWLCVTALDHSLTVALDDLDPFRPKCGLAAADRLPAANVTRWERVLADAWELLVLKHECYADAIGAGLISLVPLAGRSRKDNESATSPEAFGSCALSEPIDVESLAVTLVHEFQHVKLGALHDIIPLYTPGSNTASYSPWRDDPRPLSGLLHGAYAYLGITDFWRTQRELYDLAGMQDSMVAHFEFARWREQTWRVVDALVQSGHLTSTGHDLLMGMRDTLCGWRGETVPTEAAVAARSANADHWLSWRIRNLAPDPAEVERLAKAWLTGARPSRRGRESILAISHDTVELNPRLDLLCIRLRDPSLFASKYLHTPDPPPGDVTDGDIAYASGDMRTAVNHYRKLITADPCRKSAWAGLAVAGNWPQFSTLGQHPELVYALYQRIRELTATELDPVDLASWLDMNLSAQGHCFVTPSQSQSDYYPTWVTFRP
jgi:HEXXH motif-containing protein